MSEELKPETVPHAPDPVTEVAAPAVTAAPELPPLVPAAPAQAEAPTPSRAEQFRTSLKQRVRDKLSEQPYRGAPAFEDILAAFDALIDGLTEEGF